MLSFLGSLGRYSLFKLSSLGRSTLIFFHSIFVIPNIVKTFPLLISQVYFVGVQSVIIIIVSGLFIGMVLGLQGFNILKDFMAKTTALASARISVLASAVVVSI